jgi:glutathione S-transferase
MPQDDDGFILYESRAIARYIDAKFPNQGPKLVPAGLKANALFEQAVSVEQSHFEPCASKAFFENVVKPYVISLQKPSPTTSSRIHPRIIGLTPDTAVFDDLISQLGRKLDVYETILSKQKYIGGDVSHSFHR